MSYVTETLRPTLTSLCDHGAVIGGDVALWYVLHAQADVPLLQIGLTEVFVPPDFDASVIFQPLDQINIITWPANALTRFEVIQNAALRLEHWLILNPAHLMVRLLDLHSEQRDTECLQILADAISAVSICLGESQRLLAFEAMGPQLRDRFARIAQGFEQTHY